MAADSTWRIDLTPEVARDVARLEAWARTVANPTAALQAGLLDLPAVRDLGARVAAELDHGPGLAWLRSPSPLDPGLTSLLLLAIGLELGESIDVYGRLYDVVDHGGSYRDKPIPVSQTRESTGMHTDSSNAAVWPRVVGLACLQPAPEGGESRLACSALAYETLRARCPELLKVLHGDFFRDVVTPGSDRDPAAVRRNAFPIFRSDGGITLRYMRYWIEKGHERVDAPLTPRQLEALDALDEALEDPANTLSFRMGAGDVLFLDNATVTHGRAAYRDDPDAPRHLVRMWLDRPGAAASKLRGAPPGRPAPA